MQDNGHFTPLDAVENRASFNRRIELLPQTDQLKVRMAYDLAKYSHRGQDREGGDRYFEHVRSVALILHDECKLKDPDFLIAGLLHDSVEDATIFGSHRGLSNAEWRQEATWRITELFGPFVSEMVMAVTKPEIDGEEVQNPADIKTKYLEQLSQASPEAIVLKMADRLHNLRTLHYRKPHNQLKVARETLEDYLPVLQKGSMRYAAYSDWMLFEIRDIATAYLEGMGEYLRPDQAPGRVVNTTDQNSQNS